MELGLALVIVVWHRSTNATRCRTSDARERIRRRKEVVAHCDHIGSKQQRQLQHRESGTCTRGGNMNSMPIHEATLPQGQRRTHKAYRPAHPHGTTEPK